MANPVDVLVGRSGAVSLLLLGCASAAGCTSGSHPTTTSPSPPTTRSPAGFSVGHRWPPANGEIISGWSQVLVSAKNPNAMPGANEFCIGRQPHDPKAVCGGMYQGPHGCIVNASTSQAQQVVARWFQHGWRVITINGSDPC